MTEKRFVIPNQMRVIRDTVTGEEAIFYDTDDGLLLKEWLNALHEENEQLTKLLILIADAESTRSENSVKEILRNTLFGLDTVAGESPNAFKEYCILNKFFKEHYKELWDNDKYD